MLKITDYEEIEETEEYSSSCPSSDESELEEVISKGNLLVESFNKKVSDFLNRNNPQYLIEKEEKALRKEKERLLKNNIILEEKKIELEAQGYTLVETTPCDSKFKQYIITKKPDDVIEAERLLELEKIEKSGGIGLGESISENIYEYFKNKPGYSFSIDFRDPNNKRYYVDSIPPRTRDIHLGTRGGLSRKAG